MKILIADDHSVVRKGLVLILAEQYPHALIDEVSNSEDLLKKIEKDEYSIIISDITMPGRSGIEILKEIKEGATKTPVLILSVHAAEEYAIRAFKSGASGYLTKDSAPSELVKAVETLLRGKRYITLQIAELLAEASDDAIDKLPHETLSNREMEVMKLMLAGNNITEIAEILALNINTISTYKERIFEKLHLQNYTGLVRYAVDYKLS